MYKRTVSLIVFDPLLSKELEMSSTGALRGESLNNKVFGK